MGGERYRGNVRLVMEVPKVWRKTLKIECAKEGLTVTGLLRDLANEWMAKRTNIKEEDVPRTAQRVLQELIRMAEGKVRG